MADEQENAGQDSQVEGAPSEGGEAPAPEPPAEAAAPATPPGGSSLSMLVSLAAVGMAVAGVFSYAAGRAVPWMLGGGLLGWGLMDLLSQRRQFTQWGGKGAAWMNLMGMLRGLCFAGLGAALVLQSFGVVEAISTNALL